MGSATICASMRYKRALLSGLCGAAVMRGVRHGFADLKAASIAASEAASRVPSNLTRRIPAKPLGEILGDHSVDVRVTMQRYQDGQLPVEESLALLSILVSAGPQVVLEIGTFCGNTTKAIAANLPGGVIHTVDLPLTFDPKQEIVTAKDDFHLIAKRRVGEAFRGTEFASQIIQHFGDTATWNFALAKGADFFFIDGSHTYTYCKSDSEKCYELCGGRGVFLWHDCDDAHPGVLQFIAEWRALGRDIVRIEGTSLGYWSSL